jgi:hypothetical protein
LKSLFFTPIILAGVFLLTGCSTKILNKEAKDVRIYFNEVPKNLKCTHIDEVIGTQGELYDYYFTPNVNLTQGALNDLKNKTKILGGNSVVIYEESSYATYRRLI